MENLLLLESNKRVIFLVLQRHQKNTEYKATTERLELNHKNIDDYMYGIKKIKPLQTSSIKDYNELWTHFTLSKEQMFRKKFNLK